MADLETNIFAISNLEQLSAYYRLYRVKGLKLTHSEYYANRQSLVKRLSYVLQSPVLSIQRDDDTFIVVRDDVKDFPESYELIRRKVRFELTSDNIRLDFALRTPENDAICIKFLQFALQECLFRKQALWQPGAGRPFFERTAFKTYPNIYHYRGFTARITPTPSGGLGVALDVTSKFTARNPLPAQLVRTEFKHWENKHFVYHYGHQWYEIQAIALEDDRCGSYEVEDQGDWISLFDYILKKAPKSLPTELSALSRDDSVILYRNNQQQERAAVARLCYAVLSTHHDDEVAHLHRTTILNPPQRYEAIHHFARMYLHSIRFGSMPLKVSLNPETTRSTMFMVPDIEFGQNKIVSVQGTRDTIKTPLDQLGQVRKRMIKDRGAGFFSRSPLDRQYLVLPNSVQESYGSAFLADLQTEMKQLYPHSIYNPNIIVYDDTGRSTFEVQGAAILEAMEERPLAPGYALIMIHHTVDQRIQDEDQLAGMLTQEFRKRYDITAAVMHSKMTRGSYRARPGAGKSVDYASSPETHNRLMGYLRAVALNKILLTNQKWPFVLSQRLHADVTIGIDVKQNTVGLVVVSNGGKTIRSLIRTSRQKERLMEDQMRDYLIEMIREESLSPSAPIQTIVIHRDGRTYDSEMVGLEKGIEALKREQVLDTSATITILEIPKRSAANLRMFDVLREKNQLRIQNPQVGQYYVVNNHEGYICTTGRAFFHQGTVQPLHMYHKYGPLALEHCMEDLYALTTLSWSKPDDVSRYPITLKLCDRYLTEDATDYDSDALVRAEARGELEVDIDDE